ncbi:MAG: PnuC protein [Verrucomicrobiales bacterium]|nr:PnuC protein [Verrucomicrobiales bacterium]
MVATFVSLWLIGNKVRAGFLVGVLANVFWFGYGFLSHSIANMLASCVVAGLQYRGWHKWGAEAEAN